MTRVVKYPNISAECARYNLTQSDLAERLGVTRQTVQNWQIGKSEIPASAIVSMAKMWSVSSDYLLGLA